MAVAIRLRGVKHGHYDAMAHGQVFPFADAGEDSIDVGIVQAGQNAIERPGERAAARVVVIPICTRIKHQVRRVHDPNSAMAMQRCIGHVQTAQDDLVLVKNAVTMRLLMHGNLTRRSPAHMQS